MKRPKQVIIQDLQLARNNLEFDIYEIYPFEKNKDKLTRDAFHRIMLIDEVIKVLKRGRAKWD